MKKITLFFACVVVTIIIAACDGEFLSNGYLDTEPNQYLTLDEVFKNRNYAESFLTSIYANVPLIYNMQADPGGHVPWTAISDEMEVTYGGSEGHYINHGAWNPSNVLGVWQDYYEGIRKTNIFLKKIDGLPISDNFTKSVKEKWIGEATFLRAFFHFLLFRLYGSVPIMDYAVTTEDDYKKIKRAPVDSVVSFIVRESEKAAKLLPLTNSASEKSRVTKVAALALKSRVLLYAASPLFNGNPAYANFTDRNGEPLFPQEYEEEKWEKAAQAAKHAIEVAEAAGYGLYRGGDNPVETYQQIFLDDWNKEILWARTYGRYGHVERCQSPLGYGGYSILSVSQEMVDAYRMANGEVPILGYKNDGSPIINESSSYTEEGYTDSAGPYWQAGISNMYVNREPRFYASVHFAGSMWKGRMVEMWYSGLDGHIQNPSDYSETGYVLKKAANPNINIIQNTGWDLKTFPIFRVAELYLNYAEALNEYKGPGPEVYKYVNAIRNRGGLPDLEQGLSQKEMRKKIHRERRIELAFESHRYFDVRRWLVAEKYLDGPLYGLSVLKGHSLQDDAFYQRKVVDKRVFEFKHYLWPIPQGEINKIPELPQSPGW